MHINKDDMIHFSGIGGIGMSAIAKIMHEQGYNVQGSDSTVNDNVKNLIRTGINVFSSQDESNLKKCKLLVRSSAIRETNPEIIFAKKNNIQIIQRAKMLEFLLQGKKPIAISGAHGKTTTTSMISHILTQANLDPSFVVGGIINTTSGNHHNGQGEYFVLEADESDGSISFVDPEFSVITNLDREHMDFYKSFENLELYFKNFAIKTKKKCFVSKDDVNAFNLLRDLQNVATYSINDEADIFAENINSSFNGSFFDVMINKNFFDDELLKNFKNSFDDCVLKGANQYFKIKTVFIKSIGKHNVKNALAAIGVSLSLGIDPRDVVKYLATFDGVKRRFSTIPNSRGFNIIDDYAHHPSEISAVLTSVREIDPKKRIIAIIQPHRYTRFKDLFDKFLNVIKIPDYAVLMPIYSAGEDQIPEFSPEDLVKKSNIMNHSQNAFFAKNYDSLKNILNSIAHKNDYLIFLGAGNITKIAHEFADEK